MADKVVLISEDSPASARQNNGNFLHPDEMDSLSYIEPMENAESPLDYQRLRDLSDKVARLQREVNLVEFVMRFVGVAEIVCITLFVDGNKRSFSWTDYTFLILVSIHGICCLLCLPLDVAACPTSTEMPS